MRKLPIASISRVLWALVLVTLPVTSFRFMPFIGSGTYVRPLAIYPLALLLPVLLVRLKRGEITRPWPGALTILLAFLLIALAATAFGTTLAPIELRGVDFSDRALRTVVTLVTGLSFFVAAVWMNQTEADLKFSVKWLLVGLAAHLLWGAVQFIGLNGGYRKQLLQIQNLFSVRGLVKNKRISGFAYEPSWLAGQIATLYLPWLVAAVLMRYRALVIEPGASGKINDAQALPTKHRFAWQIAREWFTTAHLQSFIEPVLFLAALTGLLMTYSRSGLVIAFLAGAATFVLAGREAISTFWGWMLTGFDRQRWTSLPAAIQTVASRILLVVLALAALVGASVFLANKGYIATFFKSEKTDLLTYAQDVYLGPRLAYAAAALSAFETHPLTGVGLGASGFGIYQNMPDWALSGDPEIAKQMSPAATLYPNPKNLYVRLLTETGLLGFVLFLTFYLTLFADALSLLRPQALDSNPPIDRPTILLRSDLHSPLEPASIATTTNNAIPLRSDLHSPLELRHAARWLAAAGIFALTAVVLQGISQDSFAMPEMWINLGILAGATGAFKMQPGSISLANRTGTIETKKQKDLP